jgi:xanthine/CO dehydrogenase XdhC/CoxF family maturation factor
MSLRRLCERFAAWRDAGEEMVLATVVATEGSTYSKAGALMLIAGDDFQGLLSGGCLEGDLLQHARRCLNEDRARLVRYDMRDRREDELWGLGLGCDGAIEILLRPLAARHGYFPVAQITEAALAGHRSTVALVTGGDGAACGSALVAVAGEVVGSDIDQTMARALAPHCAAVDAEPGPRRIRWPDTGDAPALDALVFPVHPPLRLLLFGAGPDTVPLIQMAHDLGWYVTQVDHRPGNLTATAAAAPVDVSIDAAPGDPGTGLAMDAFDAAVVMTHHLPSDRAWLTALAGRAVPYVGLLGPAARRRRLLAEVCATLEAQGTVAARHDAAALPARTHGPAGLDIGAREPAAIALSILAEIQQFHARRG